ncbi:hypothetical protein SAMN04487897_107185 [Paenibacillus sp. yr247]|uniref:hypothetical protein n=1 Tax=Paenibacillus sp. yr247 TaxID=1761880 RepID=UPI000886B046|nr:hypothetical protein [Paenibacillus sp. yr247]SDO04738.1 hypothetical protein SAMN04487897_107185 [Paenibacillus sp. yr247]
MFIQFDEYELLKLFESEPVTIGEKEAGVFIYSKTDSFGFKLVMTFSIYEKECSLSLNHHSYETPIFDVKLKDVERISCNYKQLKIQRNNSEKCIEAIFKPNFSLNILNL